MSNLIAQRIQNINYNQPNTTVVSANPSSDIQKPVKPVINKTSVKNNSNPSFLSKHKNVINNVSILVMGAYATYLLFKGEDVSRVLPRYAKHVDFVEAKTIKDAVAFAKKHFNTTLNLGDNLDFANYVNKTLVKINNRMKGRAKMPDIVNFSEKEADDYWGSWNTATKTLTIGSSYRELVFMLERKKVPIENYLRNAIKNGGILGQDAREIEKTIPHEIGHATHYAYCPYAHRMVKLETLRKYDIDTSLTEQFLEDIKYTKGLEGLYSNYLLSCPSEFIAETFAYKILGRHLHPDIESLYAKYKGPEVPQILSLAA